MSKIDNMTEKQPPSYPLRMPQELRERLAEVAKESGRSMNAEIVARLEGSLSESSDAEMVHKLIDQLDRQELTISTLTKLAHALAVTDHNGQDDIVVAALLLKNLATRPDSQEDRDKLIDALAIAFHKAEKPSVRIRERAASKKHHKLSQD